MTNKYVLFYSSLPSYVSLFILSFLLFFPRPPSPPPQPLSLHTHTHTASRRIHLWFTTSRNTRAHHAEEEMTSSLVRVAMGNNGNGEHISPSGQTHTQALIQTHTLTHTHTHT